MRWANERFRVWRLAGKSFGLLALLCALALAGALPAGAATGEVLKALPLFLDLNGHHTIFPSLYERDAYQVVLRDFPEKRSGILFQVHWKTKGKAAAPVVLKVQLRGLAKAKPPKEITLVQQIQPRGGWFGHWTGLALRGAEYKEFGEVTAWRVTMWEGDRLLGEEQSFLW
jgi:hypothetical protein